MLLFELLGWGWKGNGSTAVKKASFYRLVNLLFNAESTVPKTTIVFHELFYVTMCFVDQSWNDLNASYMDFPKVLVEAQSRLEDKLCNIVEQGDLLDLAKSFKY